MKHDPANPKMEGERPVLPRQGPRGARFVRHARPCGLFPARRARHLAQARLAPSGASRLQPRSRRGGVHRLARPGTSPWPRAWRAGCASRARTASSSPCSATASARRARCGRRPCSPPMSASASDRHRRRQRPSDRRQASATCAIPGISAPSSRRSAGMSSRSTATTSSPRRDALGAEGGRRRQAPRRHRPHRQGQGRLLHGEPSRLAWQGPQCRATQDRACRAASCAELRRQLW